MVNFQYCNEVFRLQASHGKAWVQAGLCQCNTYIPDCRPIRAQIRQNTVAHLLLLMAAGGSRICRTAHVQGPLGCVLVVEKRPSRGSGSAAVPHPSRIVEGVPERNNIYCKLGVYAKPRLTTKEDVDPLMDISLVPWCP